MRLLNTATLRLEEHYGDHVPKYAILSHRWLVEEVSFQELQDGTAGNKAGYSKIKQCCQQAAKDGFQYAWVDTCCIDKGSSAELNEAINSMYRWYQAAAVCYVYLADVETDDVSKDTSFSTSVWFARGWTLQELIAPACVEFYNATWQRIGTKSSLKNEISRITKIDVGILDGADPDDFSVAKRMSWASNRSTTRSEDRAYSLLGLFKVNMPMLYGEGDRAFTRLQEEIMKHSDDQSIFAWSSSDSLHRGGLLATSPSDFRDCHGIVSSRSKLSRKPYSVTNKGLSIELPVVGWAMETYLAALDCEVENKPNSRIGIFLQLLPVADQCIRVQLEGRNTRIFEQTQLSKVQYKSIYVRQRELVPPQGMDRLYGFWLRTPPLPLSIAPKQPGEKPFYVSDVACRKPWSEQERILEMPTGESGTAGVVCYIWETNIHTLKLGFDVDFNPICQYVGRAYSPVFENVHGKSVAARLDPSWITGPDREILQKGDRLSGHKSDLQQTRLFIKDEVVGNKRMWVVDFVKQDPEMRHESTCDGCTLVSFNSLDALLAAAHSNSFITEHLRDTLQMHRLPRFRLLLGVRREVQGQSRTSRV